MDSKEALKLFHKMQDDYEDKITKRSWTPQIGDYITIVKDIKTRFGIVKKGYRGQVQKLHGKTKIGVCIFNIHKAIIIDIDDTKYYEPKKYKNVESIECEV